MKYIITILGIFILASCSSSTTGEVKIHAYQLDHNERPLKLFINDSLAGTVPNIAKKFSCGDKGAEALLVFPAKHGTHRLKAVDNQGNTVAEGEFIISNDNLEVKGIKGGMDARQNMECISLEIL